MNNNKLHMIVLSADQNLRQIVNSIDTRSDWLIEIVDGAPGLFSALTHRTHFLLIDESATGPGYISHVKKVRRSSPAAYIAVTGGPKADDLRQKERAEGVDEYHARPVDNRILEAALRHRMRFIRLKNSSGIVGRSPEMEEVIEAVLQVGPTEVPILIEGESGTGKDVVARAVHLASNRAVQPFEAINCGAVAEGVLESELFGHEKGSFTGATARRAGMFERAHRGTIFLDEVGETSPGMQVKLLRVLESGEILRVGGTQSITVDVRVIAATNRNLSEAVADGNFRQDLYYRLKGVKLSLPPLRKRKEDVEILLKYFLAASNKRHKRSVRGFDDAAKRTLLEYGWPGNIRELKNTIDTLVVLSPGPRITEPLVTAQLAEFERGDTSPGDKPLLPVALNRTKEEAEREMIYASILSLHRDVREILALLREPAGASRWDGFKEVRAESHDAFDDISSLAQMERLAINEALRRFSGNRRQAAELLGISERTLYRKIKEYGLI